MAGIYALLIMFLRKTTDLKVWEEKSWQPSGKQATLTCFGESNFHRSLFTLQKQEEIYYSFFH